MSTPSLASFDSTKPFYPLVMHYFLVLVGFKEVALASSIETWPQFMSRTLKYRISPNSSPEDYATLEAIKQQVEEAMASGNLLSAVSSDGVRLDSAAFGREMTANLEHLKDYMRIAAGHLLVLAHETCKDNPAHDAGLMWEFLRHCRNAVAHGGNFHFKNGEPRRPAKWRTLEILSSMNGTPLIGWRNSPGLLQVADPVLLLLDIEQAYPNLK